MSARTDHAAKAKPAKVHDFDAILAEGDEEARDPIAFQLGGETFRVAAAIDWPDDVVEMQAVAARTPNLFEPVRFARSLLGDQYDAYVAAGGNAMKFMRFMERVSGGEVGEASAS